MFKTNFLGTTKFGRTYQKLGVIAPKCPLVAAGFVATITINLIVNLEMAIVLSILLYQKAIQVSTRAPEASMGVRRYFSRGGQRRNFAYSFQVAGNAMQIDVQKSLYPFYPISMCWLNLISQSCV